MNYIANFCIVGFEGRCYNAGLMQKLILIRHGQTDWNTEGRVQGGGKLNEVGISQCHALAIELQSSQLSVVYTSPSQRAHETASIIATNLSRPIYTTPLLKDLDYGIWSGALLEHLMSDDPELFERWQKHPERVTFPEGESLSDLRLRVSTFLNCVTKKHPKENLAIVTHESPIISMVAIALEIPDSSHRCFHADNASLTVLELENKKYILSAFNNTSHLDETVKLL